MKTVIRSRVWIKQPHFWKGWHCVCASTGVMTKAEAEKEAKCYEGITAWKLTQTRRKEVITPDMLNTGLPPVRYKGSNKNTRSVNVVLALWNRKVYCASNQYMPRWAVVNTVYYRTHGDMFDGWIDLQDMDTTPLPKKGKKK